MRPGPDMFTEDMPVEMLDVLGIAAQVTTVVNDKLFLQNEHKVNQLVNLVFHGTVQSWSTGLHMMFLA